MKVSLKTFLPMSVAGAMSLTSCFSVNDAIDVYCQDNNKTANEYYELYNLPNSVVKTSRLDSLAYRDIFNTTQLAKDSSAVANFNKIAAEYRAPKNVVGSRPVKEFQRQKAIEVGMTLNEYKAMDACARPQVRQHFLDKYGYQKFFETNGIWDGNVKAMCDNYSKTLMYYLNN